MKFVLVKSENDNNYEVLTESNLNRIISGHNTDGYIMISASRLDCLDDGASIQEIIDENNKRTSRLKNDIKQLHYSYIPVYGGYKETNADFASIEKSFIVFPYDNINKSYSDFNMFMSNMIELGKEFNQDTILIKKPNENPRYYHIDSDTWDENSFGNISIKDAQKEYFTSLRKWRDSSLNKSGHDWGAYPQRLTYKESYLDYPPQNIMSANARHNNGELFSMKHFSKK